MPEYVEEAILTAMAKESSQRHESVLAFLRALRIVAPSAEKRAPFPKSKAQWFSEGHALLQSATVPRCVGRFQPGPST